MKKLLIGLSALVVAALVVVAVEAGPSFFRTSIQYIFTNGITVEGGAVDLSGASSITGDITQSSGGITAAELAGATLRVAYCGQNDENSTVYFGPPVLTAAEPTLADATCDGLDSGTETTADVVLSAGLALYPKYMRCITNGTLGASETLTFQLRDDAASATGVTCALAAGETTCEVKVPTAAAVAAASATAVRAVQVSDNTDDDSKCVVLYQVQ